MFYGLKQLLKERLHIVKIVIIASCVLQTSPINAKQNAVKFGTITFGVSSSADATRKFDGWVREQAKVTVGMKVFGMSPRIKRKKTNIKNGLGAIECWDPLDSTRCLYTRGGKAIGFYAELRGKNCYDCKIGGWLNGFVRQGFKKVSSNKRGNALTTIYKKRGMCLIAVYNNQRWRVPSIGLYGKQNGNFHYEYQAFESIELYPMSIADGLATGSLCKS